MSVLLMVALNSPIQSNHCSGSPSNMNGLTMGTDFLNVFEIV